MATGPARRNEFKRLWEAGEDFADEFPRRVVQYLGGVRAQLATQAGVDALYELPEWRREQVKLMPIAEFPLLFPSSNLIPSPRVMNPDGSVAAP
jgi:hypothetical protein